MLEQHFDANRPNHRWADDAREFIISENGTCTLP
jgi:hypothetical protein